MITYSTMGDSTEPASIPKTVDRVAGYTTGEWPTYWLLDGLFPGKPKFAFSIAADTWGDALDIERFDATIQQAPGWAANVWRPVNVTKPVLYINAANIQALVDTMGAAGWDRTRYYIHSAHYWGPQHICGPTSCNQTGGTATADATQWASYPGYDLSTVPDYFFGGDMAVQINQDDIEAIAVRVMQKLHADEAPGGELSDREKALIQNALAALPTPTATVDPATITTAVQTALTGLVQQFITALEGTTKGA